MSVATKNKKTKKKSKRKTTRGSVVATVGRSPAAVGPIQGLAMRIIEDGYHSRTMICGQMAAFLGKNWNKASGYSTINALEAAGRIRITRDGVVSITAKGARDQARARKMYG